MNKLFVVAIIASLMQLGIAPISVAAPDENIYKIENIRLHGETQSSRNGMNDAGALAGQAAPSFGAGFLGSVAAGVVTSIVGNANLGTPEGKMIVSARRVADGKPLIRVYPANENTMKLRVGDSATLEEIDGVKIFVTKNVYLPSVVTPETDQGKPVKAQNQ